LHALVNVLDVVVLLAEDPASHGSGAADYAFGHDEIPYVDF
jgi:hypothetical protein